MTKTIVITGPESSGKSTLATALAQALDVELVKEYAREYMSRLNRAYTFEDVEKMAKRQFELEKQANTTPVVLDTDLTVFFIWMKEKYDKELGWIKENLTQGDHKVYLLCYPTESWEYDPLREHPDFSERLRLFNHYKDLLKQNKLNYYVVEGDSKERLKKAKEIVLKLF